MKLSYATAFLKHYVSSHSRHGTHSPFIYAFIDECVYRNDPAIPEQVKTHFDGLKNDQRMIDGFDHGKGQQTIRSVADYARTSSIMPFQASLLHRVIAYCRPKRVLELGSNLGKSLAAMSSASPETEMIGVEGNEELAALANKSLSLLELSNAHVEHSSFDEFLKSVSGTFDVIFLDGDHHYEPTMRYFERIKTLLAAEGLIIFHDIYWSKGMKRAWDEIKKDRDVTVTVDLFFFGLAWMGKPQAKEDFVIRFPKSVRSLLF